MLHRMKRLFRRDGDERRGVMARHRRLETFAEGLERYAEAAGVAQSGHTPYAQELIRQALAEHPKILLVAGQEGFSQAVTDCAVGFAKRMKYEIVALSCLGPPGDTDPSNEGQGFGVGRSGLTVTSSLNRLTEAADSGGVPWRHLSDVGSVENCIARALERVRRVEFVLTECQRIPEGGLNLTVPVHCLWAGTGR